MTDSSASTSASPTASPATGRLVLAATPIGNVGDASARLVDLLQTADIVAAEDTRRLFDLANRLDVRVGGRVVAYHDHNERDRADGLLDEVAAGATVLVVSDAGMPLINDPGLAIVRRAIERGLPLTCAPGPSAVLDALALSGLPTDRFCYEGFVPRKRSDRLQRFRSLRAERRTIVFYETTHRIEEALDDLAAVFPVDRPLVLARELTKDYEEVRRSTVSGIRDWVAQDPPRGELVLVLAGASEEELRAAYASAAGAETVGSLTGRADDPAAATRLPDDGLPQLFSLDQLAGLALELAAADSLPIKAAIAHVVAAHPLPDGRLPNKKQVYSAVLARKER